MATHKIRQDELSEALALTFMVLGRAEMHKAASWIQNEAFCLAHRAFQNATL